MKLDPHLLQIIIGFTILVLAIVAVGIFAYSYWVKQDLSRRDRVIRTAETHRDLEPEPEPKVEEAKD